ncbi:MAG TPA: biotin carboxylase N-terminal domain-containing protein, partial [Paracoccaceae bacterium]|nr:biotin carboxylase N-terminal domain-containing protein [Paracoccaceae bacterium]
MAEGLPRRLLIANRGEIAARIAASAAELGVETVAVFSDDDGGALHVARADAAEALPGTGPAAYLDAAALVAAAGRAGCDAVHPGYGFLSEDAGFAEAVEAAGLVWIGPSPAALRTFGDKAAARAAAEAAGAPVLPGTGATDLAGARAFFEGLGRGAAVMVKAVAGGGGRGVRPVLSLDDLPAALEGSAAEARAAFGSGEVYLERLVRRARHVEVQVVGDGSAAVAVGDRECSLQRRRQKLVEVAPAPSVAPGVRERLWRASEAMAAAAGYRGVGTFEFLLDRDTGEAFFIEANARLQVEHTVTEAVTGLDLVAVQLRLAGGASLGGLGLARAPETRGAAVQARVCAEILGPDGSVRPAAGVIAAFEAPTGPGVRTDAAGFVGMAANPRFDSLLAKVVCHAPTHEAAVAKCLRALDEMRVEGVETNLPLLRGLMASAEVAANDVDTGFLEANLAALIAVGAARRRRHAAGSAAAEGPRAAAAVPEGFVAVRAPLTGTVASVALAPGSAVAAGAAVLSLEAMKMEHLALAPEAGRIERVLVGPGETVAEGAVLALIAPGEAAGDAAGAEAEPDPEHVRPDLAEALARRAATLDSARTEAVEKRRAQGRWTARESLDALLDPGSFTEYGG